jgi:hypothetical protein
LVGRPVKGEGQGGHADEQAAQPAQ